MNLRQLPPGYRLIGTVARRTDRVPPAVPMPLVACGDQPAWSLILPWPPPLSAYHTVRRGQIRLSAAGTDYQKAVFYAVAQQRKGRAPLTGRLHLCVDLHPPTLQRTRDLDNHAFKALQDALTHAHVYDDDSQFDHIEAYWASPSDSGYAAVLIEPLTQRSRSHADRTPVSWELPAGPDAIG